jgi:hypothetical protein
MKILIFLSLKRLVAMVKEIADVRGWRNGN